MGTLIDEKAKQMFRIERPVAITMWEFSWIERRWPGAGYEDWDQALEELTQRGYDAVRIDAFPHLLAADPYKEWTLNPEWNVQTWGSQSVNRITLYRNFRNFLKACRAHRVRVALSTWFREDTEKTARNIRTPEDHAQIWVRTLDFIKEWGELDNILYVDFCNECPLSVWAPFFAEKQGDGGMFGEASVNWMKAAIAEFKKHYPQIPVTFSCCHSVRNPEDDIHFLDFLEQHTWMTTGSDFYQKVGYNFERFSDVGYTNMALKGEELYRRSKDHYDQCLVDEIHRVAEWAKRWEKPVITTECWSVVDYKDWPLLNWDWILDLNELGVRTAAGTGCYAGMATSNFCGPQFVGMWRQKDWHLEMTRIIHDSKML